MAINPIGGLLLALPMAILQLAYPPWLAVLIGVPLAYVQVIAVDLGWTQLCRLKWWKWLIQRNRNPRAEALMSSGGAFWPTVILTPFLGPWLIMALMRYVQVPQRRVAVPMLFGLLWIAVLVAALSAWAPEWLDQLGAGPTA